MKIKLLRNLGMPLVRELGLEFTDDDKQAVYVEGSVREVPEPVAEKLIARGLAETTKEPVTRVVRGVAKPSEVTAPTPENFSDNPHDTSKKNK